MKYIALVTLALLVLSAPAEATNKTKVRRFAYVIGANDGGTKRVKLRYAGTDAKKVARVLRELGGVKTRDIVVTTTSSIATINAGFRSMRGKLAAARRPGVRVELILYYSGHSDETGLLVAGNKLSYKDLRARLKKMPADVNIAILDSCASGAFTRTKGGKREPAFLVDQSSQVKGYAYISSSSADEVAQESDRIASSFFTHYLISGLRGGADTNRDRRVTLNEAYQYAFAETVARTESTVAGAQHPGYNMHLVGTGDVVMTDLRSTSAALQVAANVSGRLFIRDQRGTLVLELNKPAGRPLVLGLGPGTYRVTLKAGPKLARATITLRSRKRTTLTAAAFTTGVPEKATARGDVAASVDDVYVDRPFQLSLIPQLSTIGRDKKIRLGFSLNILAGTSDALRGVEIGGLVNVMRDDTNGVQIGGLANIVGGSSEGVQIGGLANIVGHHSRGVHIGGLTNIVGKSSKGLHIGGIANIIGGDSTGLHLGGIANYTQGNAKTGQLAGVVNYTDGHVEGFQVAGVVNRAGSVKGTQVGLVNIAGKVEGTQVGLVNIARDSDASIGLVNIVPGGYHAIDVWTSDTTPLQIGAKLGSRYVYSVLSLASDQDNYLFGAGLGLHRPRDGYYLDIDALAYAVLDHGFGDADDDLLAKLRFMVGFPVMDDIHLFGGLAFTASVAFDGKEGTEMTFLSSKRYERGSSVFRLSPGFFVGVSLQ